MHRLKRRHCGWWGGELTEATGLHNCVSEVTATGFPPCLTLNKPIGVPRPPFMFSIPVSGIHRFC